MASDAIDQIFRAALERQFVDGLVALGCDVAVRTSEDKTTLVVKPPAYLPYIEIDLTLAV